eukprot:TRINITY_DN7106_c0_g1_i3.p1 TRINITY_DN7106_c0_g1~~TRINITY_DN7106_c0_g1_i3.p1  ORF type:complete len:525 (+),score=106.20 TRINITY_DN7106_c0_g1_i3:219-1577(+)
MKRKAIEFICNHLTRSNCSVHEMYSLSDEVWNTLISFVDNFEQQPHDFDDYFLESVYLGLMAYTDDPEQASGFSELKIVLRHAESLLPGYEETEDGNGSSLFAHVMAFLRNVARGDDLVDAPLLIDFFVRILEGQGKYYPLLNRMVMHSAAGLLKDKVNWKIRIEELFSHDFFLHAVQLVESHNRNIAWTALAFLSRVIELDRRKPNVSLRLAQEFKFLELLSPLQQQSIGDDLKQETLARVYARLDGTLLLREQFLQDGTISFILSCLLKTSPRLPAAQFLQRLIDEGSFDFRARACETLLDLDCLVILSKTNNESLGTLGSLICSRVAFRLIAYGAECVERKLTLVNEVIAEVFSWCEEPFIQSLQDQAKAAGQELTHTQFRQSSSVMKIIALRLMWKKHVPNDGNLLKQSANDALTLLFQFDEDLQWLSQNYRRRRFSLLLLGQDAIPS